MKTCSKCKTDQDLDQFIKSSGQCRTCRRRRNLVWRLAHPEKVKYQASDKTRERSRVYWENGGKEVALMTRYALTKEDYDRLFQSQNGQCAICFTDLDKYTHIDHSHETSEVRGLLCQLCNRGLGHFKDDVERLSNAINYLIKHGGKMTR